jgi:hypothetical protein
MTGPGVTIGSTDAATGNLQPVRFGSPETETKVRSLLNKSETIRVRLIPAGEEDVEGHLLPTGDTTAVLVRLALDDDDVEGHAMSIHFPDIDGARRFRTELLAAGVLTATVAMSAGAGIALAPSGQAAGGVSATHAAVTDTFAGAREGTIAISIGGSSTDTSANLREGGAAAVGAASSTDTSANLREGGAAAVGTASSIDTSANLREGGALAPEDKDATQQTPETYRGHRVPPL